MNRPVKHTVKFFTLVEIMIAMAVLVIMMGFLFQFINSAQKLWSSSTRTANVFDQAQLVLQLIEQDLQSVQIIDEKEYPGGSIPMILSRDADNNLINLFLFTPTEGANHNNVGMYPVLYDYDLVNNTLYRFLVDSDLTLNFVGKSLTFNPHFIFGINPLTAEKKLPLDPSDIEDSAVFLVNDTFPAIKADPAMKHFIADGIASLNIEYMPQDVSEKKTTDGKDYWFFRNAPKVVRIMLSMYDAHSVKILQDAGAASTAIEEKKTETMRTFSKIVFLR